MTIAKQQTVLCDKAFKIRPLSEKSQHGSGTHQAFTSEYNRPVLVIIRSRI